MKKSLLAVGLTLAMVLTMATPAFAAISTDANLNTETTAVTTPGNPGVKQVAGESFNAATVESKDGAAWTTANDDDAIAVASDTAADINVWAKVVDSGSKIYKVDLAWGAMKFEFNSNSGQWNTTSHTYDTAPGTATWTPTYLDGTNNKVAVTNHSNNAIDAAFAYGMSGTAFNAVATSDNAVIGNFFADNTKALAAALKLTGTYAGGAVVDATVADKLTGSKISLPTADAYNSTPGEGTATDTTKNVVAGERAGNVCFAFSGTPDAGKGKELDTFKKVGVITVTVTPNTSVELNRPTI